MNSNATTCCKAIFIIVSMSLLSLFWGCSQQKDKVLTGTWEMITYRINHNDEHKDIKVIWKMKKDGSMQQVMNYTGADITEPATWSVMGDSVLRIIYSDSQREVNWKIVSLEASAMSLEHTIPGFFVERSFIKTGN